jgi:transglutaminase-like putative cysteine protease
MPRSHFPIFFGLLLTLGTKPESKSLAEARPSSQNVDVLAVLGLWASSLGLVALIAPTARAEDPVQPVPKAEPIEYEVCFHHTLHNRTDRELRDVRVYLPVPQSDAYQRIADFRVERDTPVHITNRTDGFGNKLKRVTIGSIPPGASVRVGFSCTVALSEPMKVDLGRAATDVVEPSPQDRELYTRDHPIFGLATPVIAEAAKKLLREHPEPAERARAVHDLVASTIRYDGGGGWDPAPQVLERKRGSCTEFTYVFCALCRATGIPTRLVGASIFPANSRAPFVDKGHHRWAQAFLPELGWVDFDPTLDAGRPPKQTFVGNHHARTLILTRVGDKALQLGLAYVSSNSHTGETSRSQHFVWSQGTLPRLREALTLIEQGDRTRAKAILTELASEQRGTCAAGEAERLLAEWK